MQRRFKLVNVIMLQKIIIKNKCDKTTTKPFIALFIFPLSEIICFCIA